VPIRRYVDQGWFRVVQGRSIPTRSKLNLINNQRFSSNPGAVFPFLTQVKGSG
jgi:hypothetical protein